MGKSIRQWVSVSVLLLLAAGAGIMFVGCDLGQDLPGYTVQFDVDGGSAVQSQTVTSVLSEPVTTKTGYSVEGWYQDSSFTTQWDFTVDTVSSDMTLYVRWVADEFTVSFDSNGGTSVGSVQVAYGQTVSEPADPTKDGYLLDGWFEDSELTDSWDFSSDTVSESITLYAKWSEKIYTILSPSPGSASSSDNYGYAVDIDSTYAVVGAYGDDDTQSNLGSVYTYTYGDLSGTYGSEQELTPSDGKMGDNFGYHVATDQDRLLVSSPMADKVYFYNWVNEEWTDEQIIEPSDQDTNTDRFGFVVALDGDSAVVGAPYWDASLYDVGAVYFYTYDDNSDTWGSEQKVEDPASAYNDGFGRWVSLYGDTAVIGSYAGTVYIYTKDGTSGVWSLKQQIDKPTDAGSYFGLQVAIDGTTLAIGAQGYTGGGAVYVYTYNEGQDEWLFDELVTASDRTDSDSFGSAVAIHGNRMIIGANGEKVADASGSLRNSGAVYLYEYDPVSEEWGYEKKQVPETPVSLGGMGNRDVAITDDFAIAGYPLIYDGVTGGSAYLFDLRKK